jgi:hypothetical protein
MKFDEFVIFSIKITISLITEDSEESLVWRSGTFVSCFTVKVSTACFSEKLTTLYEPTDMS